MTFNIHIMHCHVEGAGVHNEYYDRDEDCDEYIDIEVADDTVHSDVVEMIYQDYFAYDYAMLVEPENRNEARRKAKASIEHIIKAFDAWDAATDIYRDELRKKYEEDYNNDN